MIWKSLTLFSLLLAFIYVGVVSGITYTQYTLTEVPPDIPTTETDVVLKNNNISNSDFFPYLPSLTTLDWTYNKLTSFPDLSNVSGTLQQLYIYENDISFIDPERLNALANLIYLSISHNQLGSVPDVLGPSNTLETLVLSANPLTQFPSIVGLGKSLKTLICWQCNNIGSTMPPSELSSMTQMESFRFKFCGITSFPVLPNPAKVREYWLGNNDISTIPSDLFLTHRNLELLELEHNQILSLPDPCYIPSGATIKLYGNPLDCTSWVSSMNQLVSSGSISLILDASTTCDSPATLSGRQMTSLTEQELWDGGTTQPADSQTGTVISHKLSAMPDSYLCTPAATSTWPLITLEECSLRCVANQNCVMMGYEEDVAQPEFGLCGIRDSTVMVTDTTQLFSDWFSPVP